MQCLFPFINDLLWYLQSSDWDHRLTDIIMTFCKYFRALWVLSGSARTVSTRIRIVFRLVTHVLCVTYEKSGTSTREHSKAADTLVDSGDLAPHRGP